MISLWVLCESKKSYVILALNKMPLPLRFFVLSLFLNFQVDSVYFYDIWGILIRLTDCMEKIREESFHILLFKIMWPYCIVGT